MKRVIILSPYAGDVNRNVTYAMRCVRHSLNTGDEVPLAPHLLYPQLLDDSDPQDRELGISCGLSWMLVCDVAAFYIDHGYSLGMQRERRFAESNRIIIDERVIND